jgi:hypothetical protein
MSYSECVLVALGIQQALRMFHIIYSSVNCLALPYFSTLSHKQYNSPKNYLNTECVF